MGFPLRDGIFLKMQIKMNQQVLLFMYHSPTSVNSLQNDAIESQILLTDSKKAENQEREMKQSK